jgi:flagellar biosynthesis protein FliR
MPTRVELAGWLASQGPLWLMVLARTGGLCATAPALATPGLGVRARILLTAAVGALLVPVVSETVVIPSSTGAIILATVVELVVGLGLGLASGLVVAGARQAGEVIGAQAGLSPASLFDPEAGEGVTAMGHLYALMALGIFLTLDGPLELVRGLAESYRTFPPGGMELSEAVSWGFGRVAATLALSVRLAAPMALALSIAGLALGLIGKAAPSLQLVTLSLPARTIVGLLLVLLGLVPLAGWLVEAWREVG